jgi:ketosteroid isomerase-like protein
MRRHSGIAGPAVRRSPEARQATTQEKLALVERAYHWLQEMRDGTPGAFEDAFRDDFHEKVEVCIPGAYPEGAQTFRGLEGLRRWVDTTREVWEEWRFIPERFLDAGDRVVVLVRVVARGGSSGVTLDRETAHIWTVRDDRVSRCEVYLDRSEAIAAAGLHGQVGPDV